MHIRKSDEMVRSTGAVSAGTKHQINGDTLPRTERDMGINSCADVGNGVDVRIPNGIELDTLLDYLLASWILLVQRFQRDSFRKCSWGIRGAGDEQLQSISAGQLQLTDPATTTRLLQRLQNIRFKEDLPSNLAVFFNDGTATEWHFEVSAEIRNGRVWMTSQWQPPAMSDFQADSQLRYFASVAEKLIFHSDLQISDFMSISQDELDSIWTWNFPVPPSLERCMHDIISDQAQVHPEKWAVEAWDGNLTYGQVHQYSTELAKNLRLLDDSESSVIPILFEKSRWAMVALLAVMKCGACFTLLDPAQPEGRLRTIVQQTNSTMLVASKPQATLAARIAPNATIFSVSESKFSKLYHPFAEQQARSDLPEVPVSAPMYVQFTSGSTGTPKGCVITHSQFTSGAIPRAYTVGYRSHSRVLDFASYAFDVSIDSMLCTLAHGGTLCTPSDEMRMDNLSGAMRDMRVTLAGMTPSVARTLDPDILPSLDALAVGGEAISVGDAVSWRKKTKLVNCYGPSECTIGATFNDTLGQKPYISMGKGKGCCVWVADPSDHNKLVPPAAVGELLIEGPIVGNGYLNNPEKTAEVFIEDPDFLLAGSRTTPGRRGRLYKTGDLVRYDPDGHGEVIFVGRQDQQVKLRGQRIELAEIEYNMRKHLPPDTQLAAEVIKPGGTGEPTLVSFLVEQKGSALRHLEGEIFARFTNQFHQALGELTVRLSDDLPVYMVPVAYIPLWEMPLMVSCKMDRKRLREIGASITRKDLRKFSASGAQRTRPNSESEIRLGRLWAKVLGGEADFNPNDNFFSIGGDSLRAMRLVAAARDDGIMLAVPDIMLNPTLSAMASKARSLENDDSTDVPAFSLLTVGWDTGEAQHEVAELCGVETEMVEDVYPCTPLQEGLMALSAKFPDAYVAQRVVSMSEEDATRLLKAIEMVAEDSPILRTRIVNVPGRGLFQVVLKDGRLIRSHGKDLSEYLRLDRNEPMELGKSLFRYGLVREPENHRAHVVLTAHHAIYDGWSMPLVLKRVNRAYKGLELGHPVAFKHFIKYLAELDPAESRQYWRMQLEDVSPHQFPPLPQKGYITRANSLLERYIKAPPSNLDGVTLATVIRGAWAVVSSLYMGHSDIVFGETVTGRSAPVAAIEQIEGPMITTVPIRTRLNHNQRVGDYLQSAHAQSVQQIPYEHLGLQNIRRLSPEAKEVCELRTGLVLHPKEDNAPTSHTNNEDAPASAFLPSDDAEAAREALKFNTYALMLVCTLDENGFLIMASFDSHCIGSQAMERVLNVMERVVMSILKNPNGKIGDIAALDHDELQDALSVRPGNTVTSVTPKMQANGPVDNRKLDEKCEAEPTIQSLRVVLSQILNIPRAEINAQHSFFELGGDSISAMRLVSEARPQGLELTVTQIFQASSILEMAAASKSRKTGKIIAILSRTLGIQKEDIRPADSFFELGGDSITAMRFVGEARAQGLEIAVAQIFQSGSLSEISGLAHEISATATHFQPNEPYAALGEDRYIFTPERIQPLLNSRKGNITDIYPVRPLQRIAVEGTVQTPRYSLRYELIKFDSLIDRVRLATSCQELVTRNEVLRTVFVALDGLCLGVVVDSLTVSITDVLIPEGVEGDKSVRDFIEKDIKEPKPYGSPFVGFFLFASADGKVTLVFRISHAQYDEMCLPLLFSQLSALYAGIGVPETISFTEHVTHVVQHNIPDSIPYWRNLLAGSQMAVFKPEIPLKTRKSSSIYREFDIASRPKNITIGSLPTAAWAVVLSRRLKARDVVFGEVVTGRNVGVCSADRIIGPTWQYVPFRVSLKPEWTYLDLLHFVQNQHMESSAHEGMGLSEIVTKCTDWDPNEVTWFDSVVHQAPVDWVESLDFGSGPEGNVTAAFETVYPHAEPLREWKCQAFIKDSGRKLGIEIVCFEDWREVGEAVLEDLGNVLGNFMNGEVDGRIFDGK